MTPLFSNKPISEHAGYPNGLSLSMHGDIVYEEWKSIYFKDDKKKYCLLLQQNWGSDKTLQSSYYVGVDWLHKGKLAVYVEPKLNDTAKNTDYFKMLFEGFGNADIAKYLPDIFEMKLHQPHITLPAKLDILSPLLIYQFLVVLKDIVKKRLKRTHQVQDSNLKSKIKGKIIVSQQIKQNVLKNRVLSVYCRFNNFSVDGPENRVLKKGLLFAAKYLSSGHLSEYRPALEKIVNYIRPAFNEVSDDVAYNELHTKNGNSFFKEYAKGLHLAKLIIERYGFNINSIEVSSNSITVPPFWIDMSKLYELYVLAQLRKEEYKHLIRFQLKGHYGAPDFLLVDQRHPMIIDAKYKPYYDNRYVAHDIRQLSGYARDENILAILETTPRPCNSKVIDCLIIYPFREASENSSLALKDLKIDEIPQFNKFYKKAIPLPFQGK